jgi:S-adenosylmethionine/arginine decarboxylase-like enzyme
VAATELEAHAQGRGGSWGARAAVDLRDCDLEALSDPRKIEGFIGELIPALGMEAHGDLQMGRFGDGDLEGWSAMQFIKTSTVTVHADEVGGRCFIDIFSCKSFVAEDAARIAVSFFGGQAEIRVLSRG